jgi:predicted dehydrogenase
VGKHVFCEKPMTTILDDAIRLVKKVKETNLKFMVGHNYRFIPQFDRLKQLVDSGEVGRLFYGESSYIQDLYSMEKLGPDYWRWKDPQDFFLGGAIHNVDLLRWIVGEIEQVHSYSNKGMPFYSLDDNYVTNFRFANGCIGRLLLILGTRLKNKFYVDLVAYGNKGSLKAVLQEDQVIQNADKLEGDKPVAIPVKRINSHALGIAHFVECVREDKQSPVDVIEGAKAVAVCTAAIRSAQEGKPITIEYDFL